jgi:hypothetical protein
VITPFRAVITNVAFFAESHALRQIAVLLRVSVVLIPNETPATTGQFHEHS